MKLSPIFVVGDITVTGGTATLGTQNGNEYPATITPNANVASVSVMIAAGAVEATAELSTSPGTPGYENDALRSGINSLVDGEVSISEIMYDRGPNGNSTQWIELYNSSLTEGVSLNGWELQIRNLHDREGRYIRRHHRIQRCVDFAESDDRHRPQGCCDKSPGRSGL